MKHSITFLLFNLFCLGAFCQNKAFGGRHKIPDSINATAYYAEIKITENARSKKNIFGIAANKAGIGLTHNKEQKTIQFLFYDKERKDVAFGKDAYPLGAGNAWNYDWKENETYPLLIATASDSAANKTLYSGYIYIPK